MATTKTTKATTKVKLGIKKLDFGLPTPSKATKGSACYDLYVTKTQTIRNLNVDGAVVVGTGVILDIPEGYHVKVFLRSSTGLNHRVRLANGTGIIDSDYKGEVKLLLENNSREVVMIERGQRIAQFIIEKNIDSELVEVDSVAKNDDHKGLGSTGR